MGRDHDRRAFPVRSAPWLRSGPGQAGCLLGRRGRFAPPRPARQQGRRIVARVSPPTASTRPHCSAGRRIDRRPDRASRAARWRPIRRGDADAAAGPRDQAHGQLGSWNEAPGAAVTAFRTPPSSTPAADWLTPWTRTLRRSATRRKAMAGERRVRSCAPSPDRAWSRIRPARRRPLKHLPRAERVISSPGLGLGQLDRLARASRRVRSRLLRLSGRLSVTSSRPPSRDSFRGREPRRLGR